MIRSGGICMSFIYNYLMTTKNPSQSGGDELLDKGQRLMCLADTFASYGGILAKISQLLCLENQETHVFADCEPYASSETVLHFKNQYEKHPEKFGNISELDMNVFKSGSVGQVHRCKYNGKDAIVKIQYVGLKEQFDSDIRILDLVSSYLFYFMDLSSILLEIKSKLYEELDFITEYENQQTFYELWKDHEYIHVPKLIPDVSSKTMIAMEFVDGVVLGNFISTATQEERNHIGKLLVEFVFTNLFKHGLLYPDIHFGNFIVKHDDPSSSLPHIFVTDFGCLSRLSGKLISTLKHILRNIRNCDADSFFESAKELGIVSEGITDESREYMYEYFKLQLEPLTVDTFRFTQEWLTRAVYKKTELMKNWILPPECIYLNKIPYGLYHLLTSLELEGNFWEMMQRLIED